MIIILKRFITDNFRYEQLTHLRTTYWLSGLYSWWMVAMNLLQQEPGGSSSIYKSNPCMAVSWMNVQVRGRTSIFCPCEQLHCERPLRVELPVGMHRPGLVGKTILVLQAVSSILPRIWGFSLQQIVCSATRVRILKLLHVDNCYVLDSTCTKNNRMARLIN